MTTPPTAKTLAHPDNYLEGTAKPPAHRRRTVRRRASLASRRAARTRRPRFLRHQHQRRYARRDGRALGRDGGRAPHGRLRSHRAVPHDDRSSLGRRCLPRRDAACERERPMRRGHDSRHLQAWLDEPDRPLRGLPGVARHALVTIEHVAPLLAVLLVAVWVLVLAVGHVRRRRLASGSRQVTIGVPPDVDPGGALLLWSALHDLLRPRLARLLGGQPHLAWEVAASETGTTFRVWVPE